MSSIEERLTAIEKHLSLTERSDKPAIQSHEVPEGWFLVNSDDIPWGDTDDVWQILDPYEHDTPWISTSDAKPRWPYLIVARPRGGAS